MGIKPYGNYEYLTDLAANTHKGASLKIYWGALEAKQGFDESLQEEVDRIESEREEAEEGLFPIWEETEPYELEQDIDDLFDLYGDDVLEQVADQEKQYNDVYSFLTGSGMGLDAASAQADDAVRDIPVEDVTLLEEAYPGLPALYEIDADELTALEETSDGLFSTIGNALGNAYDSVVSLVKGDDYTGPSFASADPMIALSALGSMPEDTEDGGWWKNFVDTVVGYVETGMEGLGEGAVIESKGKMAVSLAFGDFVSDRLENIEDLITDIGVAEIGNLESKGIAPVGSSYELAIGSVLDKSLEDVSTNSDVVSEIILAFQEGGLTEGEIRRWMESAWWDDKVLDAGLDPTTLHQAIMNAVTVRDVEVPTAPPVTTPIPGKGILGPYPDQTLVEPDWMQHGEPGYGPGETPLESDWQILDPMGFPVGETAPLERLLEDPKEIVPGATEVPDVGGVAGGGVAGGGATGEGVSAAPSGIEQQVMLEQPDTDAAPEFENAFWRIYNRIPGSQTMIGQSKGEDLFNLTQLIYDATVPWKERFWYNPANPSLNVSATNMGDAQDHFSNWITGKFFPNAREIRWGDTFKKGVERIRDSLVTMENMSEHPSIRWNQIKAKEAETGLSPGDIMMDTIFFEGDPGKLAKLVGMYNVYPGAPASVQRKVIDYYGNMMNAWIGSKDPVTNAARTVASFAKAFIKGTPQPPIRNIYSPALWSDIEYEDTDIWPMAGTGGPEDWNDEVIMGEAGLPQTPGLPFGDDDPFV